MVGKSTDSINKDRPVFIPPRKRQTSKKANGLQNYVDHIVNVQSRQKLSPTSPGLEDDLLKTSLILKNKQPLPQIPSMDSNMIIDIDKTASSDAIYESEDNELQIFNSSSPNSNPQHRHGSSTVTPSSYSESSLDVKLSKSQDCLSTRSSKKRVNIRADAFQPKSTRTTPEIANYEDLESGETSVLNTDDSLSRYNTKKSIDSSYLTMTGTVKRGRKKGQSVDLQINISREELEKINAVTLATVITKKENLCCICTPKIGLHILFLSILCIPFVSFISSIYSFYIGTLTWYNIFTYFNEEKTYIHKLIMSPILILAYPVGIVVCTLGLGLYAGLVQISIQFNSWLNEVADIEKGFYGWLCGFLRLADCSPYEVVILMDICLPDEPTNANTLSEELAL